MSNEEIALEFVNETLPEEFRTQFFNYLLKYERFKKQQLSIPIKSDYIVLSYWSDGNVYNGVKDEELFLAQHPDGAIHSIMRHCDGVVFKLGDALYNMGKYNIIRDFYKDHNGNKMWLSTNNKEGYGCALSVATKIILSSK